MEELQRAGQSEEAEGPTKTLIRWSRPPRPQG